MALYEIELGFEMNEQAKRAWRKRGQIARHLSEYGKAAVVDASEIDLLGMNYPVVAGDIAQAALRGLAMARGAFAEAGVNVSATDLRATLVPDEDLGMD